ncbi:MAG: NAD-dependent epimerase/dehydratase family protein [Acidobacteriia bacterium]|nr:NAD-dependent epimerase/dehydratase family protein [Terriglobia bacterium]
MTTPRVLITGGLGFIGLEVAKLLVRRKYPVLLFDNLNPQIHGAIPDFCALQLLRSAQVEVFRGDVSKPSDWAAALDNVRAVVHLAAETGTAQSMYEISRYAETNVGGTAALLNYLANHKHVVCKIILASSRSVYGEGAYECSRCGLVYPPARSDETLRAAAWQPRCPTCWRPIDATATPEDARTAPASIYAATKLAQEDLVRVAASALGIPAVVFRLQNVYGEGQSLKNPYTGILSIFSNQLRMGKTIHLYEDGQETRDFVHVSDVARAVALGLASDGADGATLNVGSGKPTSVEQVALLLGERLGARTAPRVTGEYRLGDVRHGYADLTSIHTRLQFTPEVSLDEGLTRFVEWVQTQPVEPDRLDKATGELVARGLMPAHLPDDARADLTAKVQDHAHAKAASR